MLSVGTALTVDYSLVHSVEDQGSGQRHIPLAVSCESPGSLVPGLGHQPGQSVRHLHLEGNSGDQSAHLPCSRNCKE